MTFLNWKEQIKVQFDENKLIYLEGNALIKNTTVWATVVKFGQWIRSVSYNKK